MQPVTPAVSHGNKSLWYDGQIQRRPHSYYWLSNILNFADKTINSSDWSIHFNWMWGGGGGGGVVEFVLHSKCRKWWKAVSILYTWTLLQYHLIKFSWAPFSENSVSYLVVTLEKKKAEWLIFLFPIQHLFNYLPCSLLESELLFVLWTEYFKNYLISLRPSAINELD